MDSTAPKRRVKLQAADSQGGFGPRWSDLPSLALEAVFAHLDNDDLVTAGQTCRAWRAAAKQPRLWESRNLIYAPGYEWLVRMDLPRQYKDRHCDARPFVRVVRFAPCLHWVRTGEVMLPAARKALTHSKMKLFGIEVNGRLAWPAKLLSQKEEGLKEVTLLNPNMNCLLAALRCRDLRSLYIKFERDQKYICPVLPPDVLVERRNPILSLITDGARFPEAVSSLVERFADTLEQVHVSCLPRSAALARCTHLRTLGVNLNPASAEDRHQLVAGISGKKLTFVGFKGCTDWETHSREDCKRFRRQLQLLPNVGDALCGMCPV